MTNGSISVVLRFNLDILQRDNRKDPYLKACKTFSISPVSFLTQRLGQQEIVMRYHGLGIFGAQALAQVLQSNKTLIKLDLTGNYIERGGTHVCQAMTLNTTLTHLNLSFNKLGKSAQAIGNLLSENVALKTLILKGNDIGDMEATSIAEGLKQNVCLNVLDLSHNLIGDIGGIALGQAIAVNETLVEFDLGWNTIRQRGMMAFLTGVRDNTTIQHLNVQRNGIAESAPAVFALLQKNTTIAKLSIGYCRIDDQGMLAVAKGIETNSTSVDFRDTD
ncbi:hypothetical protein EDD86DRAFT_188553 [Gorgonomyces haynaldii]|nr:hypothetical protein EDD86DRAFT_188553 [Gorgonomyces haynaldii]